MAESEFKVACSYGLCDRFTPEQQSEPANQKLCQGMLEVVAAAGGGGFLEANPCPLVAITEGMTGQDPITVDIREKLGIVAVFPGEGGLE